MPEAGQSKHLLLVYILPLVDLSGLPIRMAAVTGLISSAPLPPTLTLAMMNVGRLADRLMKGVIVTVGKGKLVALVVLWLVELAKLLVKVAMGLVEGLLLESSPDKELYAK